MGFFLNSNFLVLVDMLLLWWLVSRKPTCDAVTCFFYQAQWCLRVPPGEPPWCAGTVAPPSPVSGFCTSTVGPTTPRCTWSSVPHVTKGSSQERDLTSIRKCFIVPRTTIRCAGYVGRSLPALACFWIMFEPTQMRLLCVKDVEKNSNMNLLLKGMTRHVNGRTRKTRAYRRLLVISML